MSWWSKGGNKSQLLGLFGLVMLGSDVDIRVIFGSDITTTPPLRCPSIHIISLEPTYPSGDASIFEPPFHFTLFSFSVFSTHVGNFEISILATTEPTLIAVNDNETSTNLDQSDLIDQRLEVHVCHFGCNS